MKTLTFAPQGRPRYVKTRTFGPQGRPRHVKTHTLALPGAPQRGFHVPGRPGQWKIHIRPLDFFFCVPSVKSIAPDHFFGHHGVPPRKHVGAAQSTCFLSPPLPRAPQTRKNRYVRPLGALQGRPRHVQTRTFAPQGRPRHVKTRAPQTTFPRSWQPCLGTR